MPAAENTPLLSARDLTVVLPGDAGDVRVLDGVSLALAAGEVVDVVGPSGSGKTTLLRALARLLPGATGSLTLEGTPAESVAPVLWRSRVALLPQVPAIVPGTVRDNLLLPWRLKVRSAERAPDDDALTAALECVGLGEIALDRSASRLSVGQAARVALSRTVLTCPQVLLLDEAEAALDDESAAAVGRRARDFAAGGGAIVRVRHRGSDGLATRRLRMADGHLTEAGA